MNIFEQLVKTSYEAGELDLLLKCDPKYVCDENNNYLYAGNPAMEGVGIDEIDPISFEHLVDGVELYLYSLKSDELTSKFNDAFSQIIKEMVLSNNPAYLYFSVRITEIMYIDRLDDELPEFCAFNGILDQVLDIVREAVNQNSKALADTHLFAGKNNDDGLLGYIRDVLDREIEMFNGEGFLET